MLRSATLPACCLAWFCATTPVEAQVLFRDWKGQTSTYPYRGDHLGYGLGNAGDIDGDGRDDLILGLPYADVSGPDFGAARVVSSRTGALLWEFAGAGQDEYFGLSCDCAGDVDADGTPDVVVGAYRSSVGGNSRGRAVVYSGATGQALHTWIGHANFDFLGRAVAGIGDVDLDGHDDVAVGAINNGLPGTNTGFVDVYSGATGALLYTVYGPAGSSFFGAAVTAVGDADGDGRPDFAAGSPGMNLFSGYVGLYSGANGQFLRSWTGATGSWFGIALADLGDLDGDGVHELAVGAPDNNNLPYAGYVEVFSCASGALIHHINATSSQELGFSVAGLGDVDGDGTNDFIVGAPIEGPINQGMGAVHAYSGSTGLELFAVWSGTPGDVFGNAVIGLGDLNGDGFGDFVVGAPQGYATTPPNPTWQAGYASLYLSQCSPPAPYCAAKINSLGCTPTIYATGALASLSLSPGFRVRASSVLNSKPGILLWSLGSGNIPFGGGTLCLAPPVRRTPGQNSGGAPPAQADCSGSYSFQFSPTYLAGQGLGPGSAVFTQYWSRDPGFAAPANVGLTGGLQFLVYP